MKKILKNFIQQEIDSKKKLLEVSNTMSDEDKTLVENAIQNLQTILEKVDEAEDNSAAVEELKNTVEELNNSLTAVVEKLNQQKEDITKDKDTDMETNTFLTTNESVHAFCNAIRVSKTSDEFRKNWNDVLLENGITVQSGSEPAYLPDAIKGAISDIWEKEAGWLADLTNTGAKRFYCRYNLSEQDAEGSRAKGWTKGKTKVAQELTVGSKLLEAQFIYKLQEIDLQTKWESDEALINYVVRELASQCIYEIKRAILVGDGRASNSDYKISSFESLAKTTTDAYTTVSTATSDFLVDDIRAMVDGIHNPNGKPVYVFMSKETLRTLARVQASSTSTPVYIPTEQVAEQIGATRIIDTDLLGDTFKAVAFIPSEYYLVGENILNPTLMTAHEIYKNVDVYRYECVAGGGINAMLSSAVLKSA